MRKFLVSALFFLTACNSSQGEIVVQSPSDTLTPASSLTPQPTSEPKKETPTSLPVDTPTPTDTIPSATPQTARSIICSPLAEHTLEQLREIVSQPYDPPHPGKDERHHGVDFAYYNHAGRASIDGEGVQAIMAGRVAAAIQDRLPYGNMVIIETAYNYLPLAILDTVEIPIGYSIYHLYAHFAESPLVELSQGVDCGQLLGHVGRTGYIVPVAHLHLETRIGPAGAIFRSMVFFDTQATPEEQDAYLRWRIGGEFLHFDPITLLDIHSED